MKPPHIVAAIAVVASPVLAQRPDRGPGGPGGPGGGPGGSPGGRPGMGNGAAPEWAMVAAPAVLAVPEWANLASPGGGDHRPAPGNGGRPPIGTFPGIGHRPLPPTTDRPGGGHHRPPHGGNYWDHSRPRRPGGYWNNNHWNQRPVSAPPFRYPHGYGYRRWSAGLFLPALFLRTAYYYSDYGILGLGAPPYGYRWMRYGPDLLLVDSAPGVSATCATASFDPAWRRRPPVPPQPCRQSAPA